MGGAARDQAAAAAATTWAARRSSRRVDGARTAGRGCRASSSGWTARRSAPCRPAARLRRLLRGARLAPGWVFVRNPEPRELVAARAPRPPAPPRPPGGLADDGRSPASSAARRGSRSAAHAARVRAADGRGAGRALRSRDEEFYAVLVVARGARGRESAARAATGGRHGRRRPRDARPRPGHARGPGERERVPLLRRLWATLQSRRVPTDAFAAETIVEGSGAHHFTGALFGLFATGGARRRPSRRTSSGSSLGSDARYRPARPAASLPREAGGGGTRVGRADRALDEPPRATAPSRQRRALLEPSRAPRGGRRRAPLSLPCPAARRRTRPPRAPSRRAASCRRGSLLPRSRRPVDGRAEHRREDGSVERRVPLGGAGGAQERRPPERPDRPADRRRTPPPPRAGRPAADAPAAGSAATTARIPSTIVAPWSPSPATASRPSSRVLLRLDRLEVGAQEAPRPRRRRSRLRLRSGGRRTPRRRSAAPSGRALRGRSRAGCRRAAARAR